jgi:hypothetical protein
MESGISLISAERKRQIEEEGWTPQHDDEHDNYEMSSAACCYAQMGRGGPYSNPTAGKPPRGWPIRWGDGWWKPNPDPIKNLVKAGALIAAEIDRLQRVRNKKEGKS